MPKNSNPPLSVSSKRLTPLYDQATAANIDIPALLEYLNLGHVPVDPGAPASLSLADYYRIQNRLMILMGDETLHFSSRQLLPGSTDFVLQHISDAETLFDAMRIIARSYNLLHGGQYNAVNRRRASVEYVIDDRTFSYAPGLDLEHQYFSIESTLIFLHCMLMTIAPAVTDGITALHIRRPSPGGECAHLGYWDAPIRFGAETYRVIFDREMALANMPIPPADALTSNAVYQKITSVIAGKNEQYTDAYSVSGRVKDALTRGVVEQQDIALQMGVSVATLRRRLSHEGASFRELRQVVLNESAKRLLLENNSVADVAEKLGFSEYRAFNRAFRDWNGVTPKAFLGRKNHPEG